MLSQKKIVFTGGPGSGKTTLAEIVGRVFRNDVVVVPETASILFRGGFPRWPDPESKRAVQRAIFSTQRALEGAYVAKYPDKILILDRATIDGATYWPDGPDHFFETFNTNLESESTRYDYVVYFESGSKSEYQSNLYKNPLRQESWEEATVLADKAKQLWSKHSKIFCIQNQHAFEAKIEYVLHVVGSIVNGTVKSSA